MKKIFSILCMALMSVAMIGQEPVITFEKTEHDFGKILEEDGRVSADFTFRNDGMTPLVLSNVRASCGCTTPKWTREPVEPGQSGTITVTYNPNGRPGRFQKTVTITSNAKTPTVRVYIKGEVIPKQAKPINKYSKSVGELNMKATVLDLGVIKKGEAKHGELEYTNLKDQDLHIELATNALSDSYVINQITLPEVKKNQVGKFVFQINSANTKLYGPIEVPAYVVVNGNKVLDDAHKLLIKANIVEDFSQLTTEQKQQAPIIEVEAEVEAGTIAAGKTAKVTLPIRNSGANILEIRRVYSSDEHLSFKTVKPVKSGKKVNASIEIHTKDLKPGKYTSEVVVISNDYLNPIKRVKINYVVE